MKKLVYQFIIAFSLLSMLSCNKEAIQDSPSIEVGVSKTELINEMHLLGVHSLESTIDNTGSILVIKGENFTYSYLGENKSISFNDYKLFTGKLKDGEISCQTPSGTIIMLKLSSSLKLYSDGELTFDNEKKDVSSLSYKERLILIFLSTNYVEMTNKSLYRTNIASFKKARVAANDPVARQCRSVTLGISLDKSTAEIDAREAKPPHFSCIRWGETVCQCVTGLWGGELVVCMCFQEWACDNCKFRP